MKYIARAFRHNRSLQIVIPKQLRDEMGWGFNTHFVITAMSKTAVKITSLEDWGKEQKKREE